MAEIETRNNIWIKKWKKNEMCMESSFRIKMYLQIELQI